MIVIYNGLGLLAVVVIVVYQQVSLNWFWCSFWFPNSNKLLLRHFQDQPGS